MKRNPESLAICPSHRGSVPIGKDRADAVRAIHDDPARQRLFERLMRSESRFLFDNDPSLIPPLLNHLCDNLIRTNFCDALGLIRVSVVLGETLMNAIVHGNLEIDPRLREVDPTRHLALIEERRRKLPYRDRRVHIVVKELLHEARYVIRHEGPGFLAARPSDTDDSRTLAQGSVASMELIGPVMDEVSHNETGTEVTLVKRRYPQEVGHPILATDI